MITKMNKTEKSAKILKREKIIVFIIRITPKTNQHSDIGFRRPSWILLKKLKNDEKNLQGKFPRANMHTANI